MKYKVTGLRGYQAVDFFLDFFSPNDKVTRLPRLPGLRGLQWSARVPVLMKYKVTRLRGYQPVDFFLDFFSK